MQIIAHRGGAGLAPENTLAAFEKAIRLGVDAIEFDVRVSRDGVPVICHDADLRRTASQPVSIATSTLAELQTAKPDLVSLKQALDFIDKRCSIYLEIKPGQFTAPIVAQVKTYIQSGGSVSIASFSFVVLHSVKAALPNVPLIVLERWSGIRATRRARKLGTNQIAMNQHWLYSVYVRLMQKQGYQLYSYAINSPSRAKSWRSSGLYAAISDFPDRLMDLR